MYKVKGFILSVTVVSVLDFNNMGLDGLTVRGPAHRTLSPAQPSPFSFIRIRARPCGAACPVQGSNTDVLGGSK